MFSSRQRWKYWRLHLMVFVVIGVLMLGEYLTYFFFSLSWNIPLKKSPTDLKLLILSDPQIQGFKYEKSGVIGYITRWDSCRYLKKTFSYAMSQYQPDVVVILGDLLDEGYVASDEEFFQYEEWFKDIYDVDPSTRILLAGDNDVGGEDEPIDIHKLKRHEKYFGPVNEIVTVKNWQFFKVNTLGFLRYEFTSQDEKNVMESLNTFVATSLRKLDKNKHTLIFSHLPLRYWDAYFAVKVMNNIKPKAIFSGHDHKAKYRMYKTGMFSTEEYVLPTCSYRMGSIHMGIGVAILEENGSFHYAILKLPQRFFYLILYAVVSVLCLLYILLLVLCKIPRFNS